ncbi:uncharacterized protein MELLADRAFT_112211 [Melampsora larici-populina 98AG31]|uniref:DUF6589 domain-containing protein n=1 Tax=Melampsora larici-populina (strain 98AG31 / pathotype 3-4-7) TaxID=747676 RepID=F4S5Q9_MELLP|nr:uncharacterized protein MELLADRAFT_112211 [Melampsora larici-populina 98AG31]EGG00022.1 hypothetical protein MELLADRAFT_112211 [Melampsora larici-populina 98AG31]
MTPPSSTAPSVHTPKMVITTLKICDLMTSAGFSPKEFMLTFLSSTDKELVNRRRVMKAGLGTKGTRSIVKHFAKLTTSCASGKDSWEAIILEQASAIVNDQDMQQGYFPAGSYTSSNQIPADSFSEGSEGLRAHQVKTGMKFLHSLIHSKLSLALKTKKSAPDDDDDKDGQGTVTPDQTAPTDEVSIDGLPDEATILSLENLVFVQSTPADVAAHKLEKYSASNGAPARVTRGTHDGSVQMIKSQLAKALQESATHILPAGLSSAKLPCLKTKPPPINQIEMHQPNIHLLRMMDAPDSSADGVSRVLDAVMGQIGMDKEKYAKRVLIAGGDVGSNQLLESLRVKRFPPVKALEGIDWIVHKATLSFIMKHIAKTYSRKVIEGLEDVDLTTEAGIETLFDSVWNQYFDRSALASARTNGDHT